MPELPEVETIARGLDRRIAGDTIESVWIGDKPQPLKSPAAEIAHVLEHSRIEQVRRVGKHIVFDLTGPRTHGAKTAKHAGSGIKPKSSGGAGLAGSGTGDRAQWIV